MIEYGLTDQFKAATIAVLLAFLALGASLAGASDTRDYARTRSAPEGVASSAGADATKTNNLYGLVIGINDYASPIPTLDGAINDALDVADALKKRNAGKVWLLENKEVTRANILANWQELVKTAKPGDTVIVHLAGHGARSPELIPGTGAKGLDEFFVLSNFQMDGPNTRERIVNKEWGAMLRAAPQLKIVFVADTCHSGSMTRAFSPRKLKTRLLSRDAIIMQHDALPPPDPATWVVTPEQLSHVAFFGAVGQDEVDPEILINEQPRGALSWAVANGLRGEADLNKDGIVTKEELVTYVKNSVTTKTEGEQHPRITPGVIEITLTTTVKMTVAALPPSPPLLTMEFLRATRVPPANLIQGLRNVAMVENGKAADLTWDVADGKLRNQMQDTLLFPDGATAAVTPASETTRDYRRLSPPEMAVARDGTSDIPRIQAAIDKRQLALWLETLSASQPLTMELSPRDVVQHKGDHAALTVSGNDYPFLTVINIGPSGNINLIYPITGDSLAVPKGQGYKMDMTADGPFGAEHFVAIASETALTPLHTGLAAIDGKPQIDEFKRLVLAALRDTKYQMGIHAVFTSP